MKVFIIDGYGFVFRAFYSLPTLTSPGGVQVGSVYGFINMIMRIMHKFKPEYIVVALDYGGKNFRHEIYPDYKAKRPELPTSLLDQLPLIRTASSAMNFAIIEREGYEADDLIAAVATEVSNKGGEAVIISSDKDLTQLLTVRGVEIYDPLKDTFITEETVINKLGVKPELITDYISLAGDSSDGIPGVPGFGPKTASELINQFGKLEEIINNIENIPQTRKRELLQNNVELARLSKRLASLKIDIPNMPALEEFKFKAPDINKVSDFLRFYGFKSLYSKVQELYNINILYKEQKQANIENIDSIEDLRKFLAAAKRAGKLAILGIYSKLNELIGVSLSYNKDSYTTITFPLSNGITKEELLNELIVLIHDLSIFKITYDFKKLMHAFNINLPIEFYYSVDDIMLMDYVVSAGLEHDNIEKVIATILEVEVTEVHANIFFELHEELYSKIQQYKSIKLYKTIDLTICYILYQMEYFGIRVNESILHQLSSELSLELEKLELDIYQVAGEKFNISSPKQLGEILFEKLKLPKSKVLQKSKSYATGANILEELSEQGFEIADKILKYRQISKLKNTYIDALPKLINPKTLRIHTTFLQTSTSTGRLSSIDPNLQNIPVRSELSSRIRSAFIPAEGFEFISADYSQIELRLLSHMAGIDKLKIAFKGGHDIHTETACHIFHLMPEQVTGEYRRKAKAINFGIIYGISAFGLAKQLGISNGEADFYIQSYFRQYPGIEAYMERMKEEARRKGYVETLFGRKCFLRYINDNNMHLRRFAERAAINAPLQGTTSDIAKLAMIHLNNAFKGKKSRIILQIHDELLFEIHKSEVEWANQIIKPIMENVVKLEVPLIVEVRAGMSK